MIEREARPALERLLDAYPIATVTGPRQSGKTTLCRAVAPQLPYANLERPDLREFALGDPRGFLRRYPDGAILDEVQNVPELLSYLQVEVDADPRKGRYLLTGSRQLLLDERISQSLAGRTGLLTLLPMTLAELRSAGIALDTDGQLLHGFYPRIHDQQIDPSQALGDYLATYVERDVRMLTEIRDRTAFQRFVRLCAGRTAQLLNASQLARDAGVSHQTAHNWLSVLEASFVVFRLEPWFANVSKRLVKSPKLYFHDVGLAAHLLRIEDVRQVEFHPLRGALFENMVVCEALKARTNDGRRSNLHFYRDSTGHEVDLLMDFAGRLTGVEVKASATVRADQSQSLTKLAEVLPGGLEQRYVVYDGDEGFEREGVGYLRPAGLATEVRRAGRGG